MVTIWETFTTELFLSPECFPPSRTFPGAFARALFEVMTATRTVWMLLAVNSSSCGAAPVVCYFPGGGGASVMP
jgi:hypothetical protein